MAHMLAKLRGVAFEDIWEILERDKADHAKEGLYLEHLWRNVDDDNEVLFLFRVNDIGHAKAFIDRVHGLALKENPYANLPVMTYLEGK